ncbi:MAG: ATP-binding protein [Pyrinomonadaceae bacterium]
MSQSTFNNGPSERRLLGRIAPADLIGRATELAAIARHGRRETPDRALLLTCEPGAGASELLRQSFDLAFHAHEDMVPIYFRFGEFDRTAEAVAQRFLRTFLHHITAFRLDDTGLLAASPAVHEFVELAPAGDVAWMEGLIHAYERQRSEYDESAMIQVCLSAPLRAAQRGVLPLIMVDDLHNADLLPEGTAFVAQLYAALARANVPFVLSGRRRRIVKLVESARDEIITGPSLKLDRLDPETAGELAQRRAAGASVALNDETRDLMAQQLDGSPKLITVVIQAAIESSARLDSFRGFQTLYVDQLMGGRLGRVHSSRLDEVNLAAPRTPLLSLIELLYEGLETAGKVSTEVWKRRLQLTDDELAQVTQILAGSEFLDIDGAAVELARNSTVRLDYLRLRHRIEIQQLPRALVMAEAAMDNLKRAPLTMARQYRRSAALGIRESLARFDGQQVPLALLDYAIFRREFKGRDHEQILQRLARSADEFGLPQVIQSSFGGAVFPALRAVCDDERCAIAHGFEAGDYSDNSEIVWLAAEVDAKVEAGRGITEVWCDRLDNVARACNFARWQIWLVAPEGFSVEALTLLKGRGAIGSSAEQFRLLNSVIDGGELDDRSVDESELIIPMSEDAELAAAEAVEEIARQNHFSLEAINQIKTAVIEACINAAEHSLSPDRKTRLRVRVEDDRLIITVSSRGIQRSPNVSDTVEPASADRGMGLGLIRALMDEVEFEPVDDGTRLRLVKYREPQTAH